MKEPTIVMEQRRPPEYILEVFADPTCVKDIIKGAPVAASRLNYS